MENKRNARVIEKNSENLLAANTVRELAALMEVDIAVITETMNTYNSYCDQDKDAEFDRNPETLVKLDNTPFYAQKLTSCVEYTSGGIGCNEKDEVIKCNCSTASETR